MTNTPRTHRSSNRNHTADRRPIFEACESRRLMSATALAFHDTLYVWGDAASNGLSVSKDGSDLVVKQYTGGGHGGYTEFFRTADSNVSQIRMYGYGGADTMTVSDDVTDKVTMYGGSGGDYLKGGGGDSHLWGHGDWAGNADHDPATDDNAADILVAGEGYARLRGQGGNDSLYNSSSSSSSYSVQYGGAGNDTFYTSDNGSAAGDYLFGEAGSDKWVPAANASSHIVAFDGGSGFDTADYSAWTYGVYANPDNSEYSGRRWGERKHAIRDSVEAIRGGSSADYFVGNSKNNYFYGGDGNDYMFGDTGTDVLFGEGGNDSIYGGGGSDYLFGGDGNDYLSGWYGNDYMVGGDGNDTLDGHDGNDSLFGGDGFDNLNGGPGVDHVDYS